MPRKSRKQKEKASTRRLNVTSYGIVTYQTDSRRQNSPTKASEAEDNKSGTISEDYNDVRSDILRIAVLASLIIGLQLALRISNLQIF